MAFNSPKSISKQLKPREFSRFTEDNTHGSGVIPEKNRVLDLVNVVITDPTIAEKESFWKD